MKKKVLLIILIIAVLIPGCSGKQLPSSSPSLGSSYSFTPTPIATASFPISTSTSTVSPTVIPTLSPERASMTFISWLANNGDCRLPCVWGLEPGETTSEMRKNLFAPFGQVQGENFVISRRSEDKNPGGIGYAYQSDSSHHLFIHLDFYEEGGRIKYLSLFTDSTKDDIRIFDDANYKRFTRYYSLSRVLMTYGPPSNIYLATWPYDPFAKRDYQPFIIILVYTEFGFRVEYVFEAEKQDDQIIGCPTESVFTITTWQPKKEGVSLQEIASIGIGYEFNSSSYEYFKPIDEVTLLTIEGFYNSFIVENNMDCIVTPADVWYSAAP